MKANANNSMGTQTMSMLLNMSGVGDLLEKLLSSKGNKSASLSPAAKSVTTEVGVAKKASASLGKLETGSKGGVATKAKKDEAEELKQQQTLEGAKLKRRQLEESKTLYAKQEGEKTYFADKQKKELGAFESQQNMVKEKFLGKKPSQDQIVSFEKTQATDKKIFTEKQAKEKLAFEKVQVGENLALATRFKEQNAHQAKWQAMQKKKLEAKTAAIAKPGSAKPAKIASPSAKAAPIEISPVICNISQGDIPVANHDGVKENLVYIAA